METLWIVLLVIAGGVGLVLLLAARKPDTFRIERRAVIAAPADQIFGHLSDFHRWTAWSPWENKDPAMRREYGAKTAGPGAKYAWEGNRNVGKGAMEIVAANPPNQLAIRLDFEKPMKATNKVDFILSPAAGGTEILWRMTGKADLPFRVMSLFTDMDKMVGKDFAAGLASLKAVSEKPAG